MSSDISSANTCTSAPAADSSSAFHAAAALPPATRTLLPARDRKTGSRDNGAMRGVSDIGGNARIGDNPLELRQTRTAIGTGTQRSADSFDIGRVAGRDGVADLGQANTETRAYERAGVGESIGGAAGEQDAAFDVTECIGGEQVDDRIPMRGGACRTDKNATIKPATAEGRHPVDAARLVAVVGDVGVGGEHGRGAFAQRLERA